MDAMDDVDTVDQVDPPLSISSISSISSTRKDMLEVTKLDTAVNRIPTDRPEADGTFQWDSTTMVLVEALDRSGKKGLGFSYTAGAAAALIHEILGPVFLNRTCDVTEAWTGMVKAIRNVGRAGIAASAISAVDVALWDLKARILGVSLPRLLGVRRAAIPLYGSGGFTSYPKSMLCEQLGEWVRLGIPRVKMKIAKDWGTKLDEDRQRVKAVRDAIGPKAELFVDANGGYSVRTAIKAARCFQQESDVSYFEEPVSSNHLDQLRFIRTRIKAAVAAGEYGYDPWYFRDMLQAEAVDILQADVTRCLGITGWLRAASLADDFGVPFSAHTAPAIHGVIATAAPRIAHVEYFHDHVRIEQMFFDGLPRLVGGELVPDLDRPGLGLELKRRDAERWKTT